MQSAKQRPSPSRLAFLAKHHALDALESAGGPLGASKSLAKALLGLLSILTAFAFGDALPYLIDSAKGRPQAIQARLSTCPPFLAEPLWAKILVAPPEAVERPELAGKSAVWSSAFKMVCRQEASGAFALIFFEHGAESLARKPSFPHWLSDQIGESSTLSWRWEALPDAPASLAGWMQRDGFSPPAEQSRSLGADGLEHWRKPLAAKLALLAGRSFLGLCLSLALLLFGSIVFAIAIIAMMAMALPLFELLCKWAAKSFHGFWREEPSRMAQAEARELGSVREPAAADAKGGRL